MLNCVQATRMMSESQERELSVSERTVLRMHKWTCSGCRKFGAQLGFLRQAMRGFAAHDGGAWPDGSPDVPPDGDDAQPPGSAV